MYVHYTGITCILLMLVVHFETRLRSLDGGVAPLCTYTSQVHPFAPRRSFPLPFSRRRPTHTSAAGPLQCLRYPPHDVTVSRVLVPGNLDSRQPLRSRASVPLSHEKLTSHLSGTTCKCDRTCSVHLIARNCDETPLGGLYFADCDRPS